MEYPDPRALSEYYDIGVSTIHAELQQKMDHKNDNRTNYKHEFFTRLHVTDTRLTL